MSKQNPKGNIAKYFLVFIISCYLNKLFNTEQIFNYSDEINLINTFIFIIILAPFSILVHELGHVVFVRIFGGEITEIHIGSGKMFYNFGKFYLHYVIFWDGKYIYRNLRINNKKSKILINFGGVLFNIIFALITYFLTLIFPNKLSYILKVFLWINQISILNLLPISLKGYNLDGKQIYQLLRYGKSEIKVNNLEL